MTAKIRASLWHLPAALLQFVPAALEISQSIAAAMADGELSAEEADAIGLEIANSIDLRLRIHGRDVIHNEAQRLILRGAARIARQIIIAASYMEGA